jgi:hypothetical protein
LVATIAIAWVAHIFQRDQKNAVELADSARKEILSTRVLSRLQHSAQTILEASRAVELAGASGPQSAFFTLSLLRSQKEALGALVFSIDELAAMGALRAQKLIVMEEQAKVHASMTQVSIESISKEGADAAGLKYDLKRVEDNGKFGSEMLHCYLALGKG